LALQLLELHHVVDTAVEEGPGGLGARRPVVQPVEQGRGIDPGQGGALGVKVEIGAGVAGGVPHGVDRPVEQLQRQPGIERQGQGRQRPAGCLARADMALQPDADRARDAVADLQRRSALLLHVLDGPAVGALADMGQRLQRPAREQPLGLARRQVERPAAGPQGRPRPAVEGRLGHERVGQPVPQAGVGVDFRRIGGDLLGHVGNIGPNRGVPKGIGL